MPNWESELKGPPPGKEWSKLDVLAEVVRVATIEYDSLHTARLIITKKLFKTDVSTNHGRLSIPLNDLVDKDFLTPEEERIVDERCRGVSETDLGVVLIDPSSRKWNMNLRRWDMKKKSGNSSSTYVLVSGWNDIVSANGLKDGDTIQLWVFRSDQKLYVCLLLLERGSGKSG